MNTILLVEDEQLLREGMQEILETYGYEVITAADGQEALERLEQTTVGLVISDLVMPNMNGVDFVSTIRSKFPELPIIVVSGSPGAVMRRLGIETIQIPGATASIMKPFKSRELVTLIQELMPT